MDPFLEHPWFFPGLHGALVYCISRALQPILPERYYAVLNERLWVESSDRPIEPDVDVLYEGPQPSRTRAGVQAATAAAQPIVITVLHDERRETFVDIMTRTDSDEKVVTTIEVLSLSNKTRGERGRTLYLRKQKEVIGSQINLVEIDLLRAGRHTTAVPQRKLRRKAGPFDYHVCVAPAHDWMNRYVYTFHMQDRLPEIDIPLLPGDGPTRLDLQAVFDRCYDEGPFSRRIRYELDRVVPPLTAEQAAWAAEQLGKQ
jgi:hypothetical protein